MRGKIRQINTNRGYAFISGDDGIDYFFHRSAGRQAFDEGQVGDVVMFEHRHTSRGPRASQVERV